MAEGIARTTFLCRACGKMVVAGQDRAKWQGGLAGSSRHFDCYGKPDRFDMEGKPLGDGLEEVVGPRPALPERVHHPVPVEPTPGPPANPETPPWEENRKRVPPKEVDAVGLIAAALLPRLETALRSKFASEEDVRRILAAAKTGLDKQEVAQIVANMLPSRGFVEVNVRVVIPVDAGMTAVA